jgi:chitin disaccharide deacetylase
LKGTFVLCADDFAIAEGVSRAVLNLVDARRLTAVSAMSSMPAWPELAAELFARRGVVAIGLHLDLTLCPFARKQRPFGLSELIVGSLGQRLDASAIGAEFERQFDLFETALGVAPDHVDGHHHVHALPQVRDALLMILRRRYGPLAAGLRPLIRVPGDAIGRILRRRSARGKALTVAALSAGFGRGVAAAAFATNFGFSGFSQFGAGKRYEDEFHEFLKALGPRHLIMCHPGLASDALARLDPLARSREEEYVSLMERDDLLREMIRIERSMDRPDGAFAAWSAPLS